MIQFIQQWLQSWLLRATCGPQALRCAPDLNNCLGSTLLTASGKTNSNPKMVILGMTQLDPLWKNS